jgi:hypothetical protein
LTIGNSATCRYRNAESRALFIKATPTHRHQNVTNSSPSPAYNINSFATLEFAVPLFFDLFRHEPTFVYVTAGDYLFREGDSTKEVMYVLIAGKANILIGEKIVESADVGTVVGEMGIIHPSEQRSASVLALTDCQFAELNAKRFKYLISEAPYFAIELMQVMADRLRRVDALLTKPSS